MFSVIIGLNHKQKLTKKKKKMWVVHQLLLYVTRHTGFSWHILTWNEKYMQIFFILATMYYVKVKYVTKATPPSLSQPPLPFQPVWSQPEFSQLLNHWSTFSLQSYRVLRNDVTSNSLSLSLSFSLEYSSQFF